MCDRTKTLIAERDARIARRREEKAFLAAHAAAAAAAAAPGTTSAATGGGGGGGGAGGAEGEGEDGTVVYWGLDTAATAATDGSADGNHTNPSAPAAAATAPGTEMVEDDDDGEPAIPPAPAYTPDLPPLRLTVRAGAAARPMIEAAAKAEQEVEATRPPSMPPRYVIQPLDNTLSCYFSPIFRGPLQRLSLSRCAA